MEKKKLEQLKKSLPFLHREELRLICERYEISGLSLKGSKPQLLERIFYFFETGKRLEEQTIPLISKTTKRSVPPLHPTSLMLHDAYKNDLKTRLFFKKIIGDHFHFTAFGIDWLKKRWLEGRPPTYQAFADMWESEFRKRQQQKPVPKKEWAYLCFTQQFLAMNPQATRKALLEAWHQERERNKKIVFELVATPTSTPRQGKF